MLAAVGLAVVSQWPSSAQAGDHRVTYSPSPTVAWGGDTEVRAFTVTRTGPSNEPAATVGRLAFTSSLPMVPEQVKASLCVRLSNDDCGPALPVRSEDGRLVVDFPIPMSDGQLTATVMVGLRLLSPPDHSAGPLDPAAVEVEARWISANGTALATDPIRDEIDVLPVDIRVGVPGSGFGSLEPFETLSSLIPRDNPTTSVFSDVTTGLVVSTDGARLSGDELTVINGATDVEVAGSALPDGSLFYELDVAPFAKGTFFMRANYHVLPDFPADTLVLSALVRENTTSSIVARATELRLKVAQPKPPSTPVPTTAPTTSPENTAPPTTTSPGQITIPPTASERPAPVVVSGPSADLPNTGASLAPLVVGGLLLLAGVLVLVLHGRKRRMRTVSLDNS